MLSIRSWIAPILVAVSCGGSGIAADPAPPPVFDVPPRPGGAFQLLDGDRVVFVGDTLIERAQSADYLETFFTVRYPDRQIIFRNLGWSGDTVGGEARAGFGTPADGFVQLRQQVYALQPTVIFVAYGGGSSFDGEAGIEAFVDGYRALLDMLQVTQAEIILLSPIRHEDLGPPLPDATRHNRSLVAYLVAVSRLAERRRLRFIDLFHEVMPLAERQQRRFTDNGIHLTDYGYWRLARTLGRELGFDSEATSRLTLDAEAGRLLGAVGATSEASVTQIITEPGRLRFLLTDRRLSDPAAPQYEEGGRILAVQGLDAGNYTLSVDGQPVRAGSAEEWAGGQRLRTGPEFDQVEALRKAIVAKNRLYFHRWRPQNETYLFGFRKYEQGQNAKEIPMFDPLVTAQEAKIAKLRIPQPRAYELVREK